MPETKKSQPALLHWPTMVVVSLIVLAAIGQNYAGATWLTHYGIRESKIDYASWQENRGWPFTHNAKNVVRSMQWIHQQPESGTNPNIYWSTLRLAANVGIAIVLVPFSASWCALQATGDPVVVGGSTVHVGVGG